MYSVDRIENNKVILIDLDTKEVFVKDKEFFSFDVKEKDIVKLFNNNYIKDDDKTNSIKEEIKNMFDNLKS